MTTETTVRGIPVEIVRKAIKHVHLAVYPPDGRVRIAVPLNVSDSLVHAALATRIDWIRRQQATFKARERETAREFVSGETHWFEGRRYRLRIREGPRSGVRVRPGNVLELTSPPNSDRRRRAAVLDNWYRARLRERVPGMIEEWAPVVGVQVGDWRLRRMKTRWGSARATSGRIWLNVELAKKPRAHLEYVVVHELLHLAVRRHSYEFTRQLDALLPHWRLVRDELGALPLGHESWPD
jgi:predicted metal-dependent hydrolase